VVAMLEKIFTNILVIILGYIVKRIKILPEETGTVFSRFVMYITLPATILKIFLTSNLDKNLFVLPFVSIFLGFFVFFVGREILKRINLDEKTKWTLLISICGYNVGLFSYPFIQSAYGDYGLSYMAMFDMGNSFIVFGLAYAISLIAMEEGKIDFGKVLKKVILFFPLDIYFAALILNLFHVRFPEIFLNVISQIAAPNSFLALFTIGFFLDLNLNMEEIKALIWGVLIRLIPGIIFSILLFTIFGPSFIVRIISIGSLLPAPLVAVIYSHERGLNEKFASVFISVTIIIGMITMLVLIK